MAQFLRQQGYRASAIRGGYLAWKQAGYPTQAKEVEVEPALTGVCPECHESIASHMM